MTRLLSILSIVAMSASAVQAQTQGVPEPSVVVAQGEAIVKRAPDRAWFTVATEVREGKAADARRKSAEAMTAVQAALTATGLPGDAIRTTGFSLRPEMNYGPGRPSIRNYVVRNHIEVRVDNLDRLGEVIDAANSPRNVAVTISNPRFELKSREAVEIEAVREAVRLATARAQAMAEGAGQALGPIVRIQQGPVQVAIPSPQPRPADRDIVPLAAGRGGGADRARAVESVDFETPMTPGELEIRAFVTVTATLRVK
jgi:uncharacterized protein YggE